MAEGDNSISGAHPAGDEASFSVTTTTDGKLLNTVRQRLVVVACWRLNEGVFEFDSSFVGPQIAPDLELLASVAKDNPKAPASVFGHADPTGEDAYNKTLSGRRALAIYGLLVRDTAIWEDLQTNPFQGDRWSLKSTQTALAHVRGSDGSPFYRGSIDGKEGPLTENAVKDFQKANGLTADGDAGPTTRKVLFLKYMDSLSTPNGRFVMSKAAFLDGGADPDLRRACQGCGEFNPVRLIEASAQTDKKGPDALRDLRNASNRRVMLFFFRPGTVVTASEWPCPSVKEGPSRCRLQFWPDGDVRRKPGSVERNYASDRKTMACRFYDRFARVSPCEGISPLAASRFGDTAVIGPGDSSSSSTGGDDDQATLPAQLGVSRGP